MCPAPLTCACVYFSGVLCRLCPMKAADEGIYTGERGNFLPLSHRNGLSRRDSPLERKHGGFSFPERAGTSVLWPRYRPFILSIIAATRKKKRFVRMLLRPQNKLKQGGEGHVKMASIVTYVRIYNNLSHQFRMRICIFFSIESVKRV